MRLSVVMALFALVLALAACEFAASPGTSSLAPTEVAQATGAPRADRTPSGNFTPRPGQRGQGTPAPNGTPPANSSATTPATLVAPTVVVVEAITQTSGLAPTAVPIPNIIIPTPLPPGSSTGNTSGDAGNTTGDANQPTDKGGNPLPPLVTPVLDTTTSGAPPVPTSAPSNANLASLRGKIVFFSDRGGLYPQLYVMNPDGSDPQLCNCSDLLPGLVQRDISSPDKQAFLFVKQLGTARKPDFQIWVHNSQTNQDQALTGAADTFPGVDYDPTWSPDSRHIAWVTEANGFDEIYVFDRVANDNVRLTESHGEWYKHPSYSPDGALLTYWTNLGNLNQKQIWVMNADGSQQHNISNNQFNDWDPIWVK